MPSEDEKSAIDKIREEISVSVTPTAEEIEQEEKELSDETTEEEGEDETSEVETSDEAEEDSQEGEVEETEEEKEKKAEKDRRRNDRAERRINRINGEKRALEAQIAELNRIIAQKNENGESLTAEEVNQRARALAEEQIQKHQYDGDIQKTFGKAKMKDKTFMSRINEACNDIGEPVPFNMVGFLAELDNGDDVLIHLSNNVDELEDLINMDKNPRKLAVALVKLGGKLEQANKAPAKPVKKISKVPEPIKPVGNGGRAKPPLDAISDMDEWVAERERQLKEKGKLVR